MATKYLLPCPCGKSTPVELAQAGETITCDCGAKIAAPTMRGLKSLPIAAATAPARQARAWGSDQGDWRAGQRDWGPGQGLSFLGAAVLLVGLATLVYFYASRPTPDVDRLAGQIAALPPVEAWRIWEMFQRGLPGPLTLETATILQEAQSRQRVFATGCVVAILGAAIAAAGVSYILAYKPRRGSAS